MNENFCRNCGSNEVNILDNGNYAPFFMFKVPQATKEENYYRFKTIKTEIGYNKIFQDVTSIIICQECNFISPKKCFSFEDLTNLYNGYRSDKYNAERVCFEPGYREIAVMLDSSEFLDKRKKSCWNFLSKNFKNKKFNNICDFGGADGKLIPDELIKISNKIIINEVSGIELCNKDFIKQSIIEDESIDLALCMHVLEHLGNPAEYFRHILSKIKPGSMLYVEVPLEIDDFYIENLKNKKIFVTIHEHINKYSEKSLKYLAIKNNTDIIDFSYLNQNIAILLQKQE